MFSAHGESETQGREHRRHLRKRLSSLNRETMHTGIKVAFDFAGKRAVRDTWALGELRYGRRAACTAEPSRAVSTPSRKNVRAEPLR